MKTKDKRRLFVINKTIDLKLTHQLSGHPLKKVVFAVLVKLISLFSQLSVIYILVSNL